MSLKIDLRKHKGRTFEWLFFNAPQYVEWLVENGIPHQDHFGEEEREHFEALYDRARNLGGICRQCDQRSVTRMGLTTSHKTHELLAVGFYCSECEYLGGSRTGYYHASFFVEAYPLEPREQKMLIREIKRHYLGDGNLTQKKMEAFFNNPANFLANIGAETT